MTRSSSAPVRGQGSRGTTVLTRRCPLLHPPPPVQEGTLVSRTVSTEIVYNVSAARNIGKALSQFGVSDACTSVLFVLLNPSRATLAAVRGLVDGDEVEDVGAGLAAGADMRAVRERYDITEAEVAAGNVVDSIATRIAVRDVR
jgi:EKC/KEOPS complex subunit CGI121/TPRKB